MFSRLPGRVSVACLLALPFCSESAWAVVPTPGNVAGLITDTTATPLEGITVTVVCDGEILWSGVSGVDGTYESPGLLCNFDSFFYVYLFTSGPSAYIHEVYDDHQYLVNPDIGAGDPVLVGTNNTSWASFELASADSLLFHDSFESGDTSAWSSSVDGSGLTASAGDRE